MSWGLQLHIVPCHLFMYPVRRACPVHLINAAALQTQTTLDPKAKNSIRYLSLHDNKYIKFFPAHTKPVTALSMSAKSDHFISTGMVRFSLDLDSMPSHVYAIVDCHRRGALISRLFRMLARLIVRNLRCECVIFPCRTRSCSCGIYEHRMHRQRWISQASLFVQWMRKASCLLPVQAALSACLMHDHTSMAHSCRFLCP